MTLLTKIIGGAAMSLLFGGAVCAGSFEDASNACLEKFASSHDAASVLLECNADGGKLTGCKAVENSQPNKGFDKAAICVAETLPMGGRTGTVKIPIRFAGS